MLKLILLILSVSLISGLSHAQDEPEKKELILRIDEKGETVIGGFRFESKNCTLADFEKEFGKGKVTEGTSSDFVDYDDLGLRLEVRKSGKLEKIDVYLSSNPLFSVGETMKVFPGKILFKDIEVKPEHLLKDLGNDFISKKYIRKQSVERSFIAKSNKVGWWFYPESGEKPLTPGKKVGQITLWTLGPRR